MVTPSMSQASVQVPPQIGAMLLQLAETADLDAALRKVITEYLALKLAALADNQAQFEAKWGMPFREFDDRRVAGGLEQDSHSYAVELDFWEWEQVETLLAYYRDLQKQWT